MEELVLGTKVTIICFINFETDDLVLGKVRDKRCCIVITERRLIHRNSIIII